MFKKYFLLFLVFFSHGMALSQDGVEEVKKSGWSTKKKVVVGVAAVAVLTATGVIIYYGPVACIASIKATAVAAKLKVVTLAAKATGAGHVFTGADGVVYVLSADGTVVVGGAGAGTVATGGAGTGTYVGGGLVGAAVVKPAGEAIRDALMDQAKKTDLGVTIRSVLVDQAEKTKLGVTVKVINHLTEHLKHKPETLASIKMRCLINSLNAKKLIDLTSYKAPSLKFSISPKIVVVKANEITNEDLCVAYNYVKGSLESVRDAVRAGLNYDQSDFKEEIEEEWTPNPLITERLNRMYGKEPLQSSDILQKFPC